MYVRSLTVIKEWGGVTMNVGLMVVIVIYVAIILFTRFGYERQVNRSEEEIAWLRLEIREALKRERKTIDIANYYKNGMEDTHEQNVKLLKAMNQRGGVNR